MDTSRIWRAPVLFAVLHLAVPIGLAGQDVQPRVYTPAPVGVNAITLNYAFSTGRVLFDKTIPVENVEGDIHSISAAYSRTLDVFGLSGRADIGVPFVIGNWTGDVELSGRTTASRSGFGDPIARFALFLIGAPALTRAEFAQFRPKTVVGATVRVRIPLGQYDAGRLINLGSNRWGFSPQLGVSHIAAGRLLLEAYVLDGATERGISASMGRELEREINQREGLRTRLLHVVFIPAPRSQLVSYLTAGLADIAMGNLTVTDSRREMVDFTIPFIQNSEALVVTGSGAPDIRTVDDLAGRGVYSRASYHESLTELSLTLQERGLAPIRIETADEWLEPDEVLELVGAGVVPL